MRKVLLSSVCAVAMMAFGASQARANVFSFSFGGETLSGDTVTGVDTWTVAGIAGGADQLFNESYYVQFGAGAINLISPDVFEVLSPSSFLVGYDVTAGNGLCTSGNISGCEVTITHTLSGGTGWSSSFGFFNMSNFNIYTYADYDLSNTIGNDTGAYLGGGRFVQSDNLTSLVWQINSISAHDMALYPTLLPLGVLQGRNSASGDVTFVAENSYAGSPQAFSIDRFVSPVPEPASMLLLGSGLFGLAGAARRRFSKKAK